MAPPTQALFVVLVIRSAFSQRLDMVALRGQGYAAYALALDTQGIAPEQVSAHGLQPAPGDALGRCRLLGPLHLRMTWAAAGAVTHQHTAARMTTRFRSCFRHGFVCAGYVSSALIAKAVAW